jgi:hypothetical protein
MSAVGVLAYRVQADDQYQTDAMIVQLSIPPGPSNIFNLKQGNFDSKTMFGDYRCLQCVLSSLDDDAQ